MRSIILGLGCIVLLGCSRPAGIDLSQLNEERIDQKDLPREYLALVEKNSRPGGYSADLTTIDQVRISTKQIQALSFIGRTEFTIGSEKFYLPWNGNRESPPFFLKDHQLYYCVMSYDPRDTAYARIDLSSHLEY